MLVSIGWGPWGLCHLKLHGITMNPLNPHFLPISLEDFSIQLSIGPQLRVNEKIWQHRQCSTCYWLLEQISHCPGSMLTLKFKIESEVLEFGEHMCWSWYYMGRRPIEIRALAQEDRVQICKTFEAQAAKTFQVWGSGCSRYSGFQIVRCVKSSK